MAKNKSKNWLLALQHNEINCGKSAIGQGKLEFSKSNYNQINEIPVEEILMAGYTTGIQIWMKPGKILTKVDSSQYLRYSSIKDD